MVNYYEILGLSSSAGINEIKAAFRQLAKLYHPDVNPQGKEKFGSILKAYETLSDPQKKTAYDRRLLNSKNSEASKTTSGTKNCRFDERELRRRRFYDEHIKQYEKTSPAPPDTSTHKVHYNEYKYILFATPLAVLLFLGIMSITSSRNVILSSVESPQASSEKAEQNSSDLKLGDSPYYDYFGNPLYVNNSTISMHLINLTGYDIVVCLFRENAMVRNFFIKNNYEAEVAQLPSDALSISYSSGNFFDNGLKLSGGKVKGGFSKDQKFYKSMLPVTLNSLNELTLTPGVNEGFEEINENEFFKK